MSSTVICNPTTSTIICERSARLADRLERGARDLAEFARSLTDAEWHMTTPGDGRTVGTIVHHVATVYPLEVHLATMMAAGTWSEEELAAEFAEIILGQKPARDNPTETIVFESLGMPAFDATAAAWVYRWAVDHNMGKEFTLF